MSLTAQTVTNYYTGILRQTPTTAEVNSLISLYTTTTELTDFLLGVANTEVDPVVRLYQAAFDRVPDTGGMTYWVNQYTVNGGTMSLAQMATAWTSQPEFINDYGGFLNATPPNYRAYVSALYVNVLGRQGETAGINYWTNELTTGARNPANVLLEFSQSPEFTNTVGDAVNNFLTECGQYANGDISTAPYTGTIWDFGSFGATYTLTTGIDTFTGTSYNDTFNANFGLNPTTGEYTLQTLNAYDSLNGNGGTDTLNVQISSTVTPLSLQNIEVVNVTATSASTLGLANAGQVTNVNANSSSADLVVSGIAAGADLSVSNITAADMDTTFTYATVTGAQSANLAVNNLSQTGADHTAAIVIDGVETINVTASGNASSYVLDADAATTVTLAGDATQNVLFDDGRITSGTLKLTLVDASASTGAVNVTMNNQSAAGAGNDLSVLGGQGNDTLNVVAETTNDIYVAGGLGNDTFVFGGNLATTDTVAGGLGTDTLSVTYNGAGITTTKISGIETLSLSNAVAADTTYTLSNLQAGIQNVTLAAGSDNAVVTTVIFDSGVNGTVNLAAALGAGASTLALQSAGTGTSDAVTVAHTNSADTFAGAAITATGTETLNLTSTSTTSTGQTTGVITAVSGTTAVNFSGNNSFSVGAVTAGSINASGLTGTAALVQGTAAVGVTSITGSSNGDTLVGVAAAATTIYGGAGNDGITGGSAADALHGEAGNDVIVGGGGNDTITGGDGNDTITATTGSVSIDGGAGNDVVNIGDSLTSGDVINGGTGVNTLRESVALIAPYANVTNFQTLQLDGASLTQNMANFTGNTFTRTDIAATGSQSLTNVGSAMQELRIIDGTTLASVALATDTSADTLTIGAQTDAATTVTGVTANDIETMTVGAGANTAVNNFEVTTLTDADLVTLNVTGNVNFVSALADQGATEVFTTLNAASNTGTVVFNASLQDITGITMTGSSTAANTLTGGSGNDVITGGSAADTLVGGSGNDYISGGSGSDNLSGGAGVDTLVAGVGSDMLTGGASGDSIVIGATAQTVNYAAATDTYSNASLVTSGTTVLTGADVIDFSALTTTGNTVKMDLSSLGALLADFSHTTVQSSITALAVKDTEVVTGSYNSLTGIFTAGAATASANADMLVLVNDATTYQAVVLVGVAGHNAASLGMAAGDVLTITLA